MHLNTCLYSRGRSEVVRGGREKEKGREGEERVRERGR